MISNPAISTVILCGKEVWGHKAGHSLLALYDNGIAPDGRIIDSHSPDPVLTVSLKDTKQFQKQITIINQINQTDPEKIIKLVNTLL